MELHRLRVDHGLHPPSLGHSGNPCVVRNCIRGGGWAPASRKTRRPRRLARRSHALASRTAHHPQWSTRRGWAPASRMYGVFHGVLHCRPQWSIQSAQAQAYQASFEM